MNRETLKKIDRFLTFGDIKPKVDETDCYYITDQAMQKVIDGLTEEKLQLERQIIADRLIEIKNRAGQVEPLVSLPPIKWQYEDELPELTDKEYDGMFDFSRVIDGVRMFPYMEINNAKHYLRSN